MPGRRFTDEIEQEVVEKYKSGMGTVVLGREYGVSANVIRAAVIRNGLTPRTRADAYELLSPSVKHELMRGMSLSPQAAYWIGFIVADGCVTRGKHGSWRTCIKLILSDISHLEKLKNYLEAETNLHISKNTVTLSIPSNILAENLMEHGITPRKSLTVKAPDYLKYNRDFWRGVIDGDGCIDAKRKRITLISGSRDLINQFCDFVKVTTGYTTRVHVRGYSSALNAYVSDRGAVEVVSILYSGSSVSLDRKQTLANMLIDSRR